MIKLLYTYIKQHSLDAITVFVLAIAQVILQLAIVSMTKHILDGGVKQGDLHAILTASGIMLVLTVTMGAIVVLSAFISSRLSARFGFLIKKDLFNKILSFSSADFDHFGTSSLMSRATSDVATMQTLLVNLLRTSMLVPFIIVGLIVATLLIDFELSLILIVSFVITVTFMVVQCARSIPLFTAYRSLLDRLNVLMKENIIGARTIRAFGRETYTKEQFNDLNNLSAEESLRASLTTYYLTPLALIVMNLAVVIIYFAGTQKLMVGSIVISDLVLFFQYVAYFIASLAIVPFLVNLIPQAVVASRRISEILTHTPLSMSSSGDTSALSAMSTNKGASIEFRNVSFAYGSGKPVLHNISFTVPQGSTLAFIGQTGSGKSTIINLMNRMYDATSGQILINGIDVTHAPASEVHRLISVAPQKSLVLHDTVFVNISMGNPAVSEEDARIASDAMMFSEVLDRNNADLHFMMEPQGTNVSGGQRQRLNLARAYALPTAIYIFDDSFSALDVKTESVVRARLKERLQDKTVIMVAQKIRTVRDADQIIVLEQGRIAAIGTHNELMKHSELYQNICASQQYDEDEK